MPEDPSRPGERGCLSVDTVERFLCGELSEAALGAIDEHLNRCALCRRVVADTAAFAGEGEGAQGEPSPVEPPLLPAGTKVARFEIREMLGVGAAAVVYSAYDPELERPVALKLLRGGGAASEESRERLLREARAMARLAHPNVVSIYDAGVYGQRVYIVMERVEGTSLLGWLAAPRTWREILAAFIEAGQGLAAAHASQLVHRDFKPENVLMASDGRARVTDFGLARTEAKAADTAPGDEGVAVRGAEIPAGVTTAVRGAEIPAGVTTLAGTPAFMAPELWRGAAPNARSDQFSFCVALYGALFGGHPFIRDAKSAHTIADVARRLVRAEVLTPPVDSPAPSWIFDILRRGLHADPDARFPSMDSLLDALRRGLAANATKTDRHRLQAWAASAIGVVAVGGALYLGLRGREPPRDGSPRPVAAARAICGNGTREPGEECDDGNRDEHDGCLPSCRFARCGDGVVRRHVEDCDDGNRIDGDGCTSTCLRCEESEARFFWSGSGSCYTRVDAGLNWQEAIRACLAQDASLVTYDMPAEQETVAPRLLRGSAAQYWIGATFSVLAKEYVWISGGPERVWSHDEKNTGCLVDSHARRRTSKSCTEPHAFVCKRRPWVIRAETNHAYKGFFWEMSWDDGQALCRRHGGHLVTLADDQERSFVSANFFGSRWIGARKERAGDNYLWLTGGTVPQAFFQIGEPNNATFPACVVMTPDNRLRDRDCDGRAGTPWIAGPHRVICEID